MVIDKDKYSKNLNNLTYSRVLGTSSPRGRIYDRNYNIIVDNKSLKTITYQKQRRNACLLFDQEVDDTAFLFCSGS